MLVYILLSYGRMYLGCYYFIDSVLVRLIDLFTEDIVRQGHLIGKTRVVFSGPAILKYGKMLGFSYSQNGFSCR